MRNDGLDGSICDDTRNDWLARELREENYHGCMDHGGAHAEGRADNRGWAAKNAKREGYRECAPHERQHFAAQKGRQKASPGKVVGTAIAVIVIVNLLTNLIFNIFGV